MSSITIPIGGMTCDACVQRVERAIGKMDGVESVSVNFSAEKATVSYEPRKIRASAIREIIEKVGYKALRSANYNIFQIAGGNFHAVHSLYFETAGMIITLIMLGKTLEAVSKGRTGEAIRKLMGLAPKTATVIQDGNPPQQKKP